MGCCGPSATDADGGMTMREIVQDFIGSALLAMIYISILIAFVHVIDVAAYALGLAVDMYQGVE